MDKRFGCFDVDDNGLVLEEEFIFVEFCKFFVELDIDFSGGFLKDEFMKMCKGYKWDW